MNLLRTSVVAALAAAGLLVAGCSSDPREGYSFSPSFRTDVKSISVAMWSNNTYYTGMESKIAEALVNELQRTSPYKVTTGENAASVLEGTLTGVEMKTLTTSRDTGLVQELSLEVVCDFTWKDTHTGKTLLARRNFSAARSFVPSHTVGERIEVGEAAAVQQLAKDIVNLMRSGW